MDPDRHRLSWRIERLRGAVEPAIAAVVADQATTYWNRPARRSVSDAGDGVLVEWSIDGARIVALEVGPTGPAHVTVHDLGALRPLRQRLRSRRVVIGLAPPASGP